MAIKYYILYLLFHCCLNGNAQSHINGPLKTATKNPRYFSDNSGSVIYLTGSHTWGNLQDIVVPGEKSFDYPAYLDMMQKNGQNFMRMWMFEQPLMASWTSDSISFNPLPFARTGPGLARDGKPKFDLKKYNTVYFNRLRKRIIAAGKKNIYVSVMLFQGWCLDRTGFRTGNPFPYLAYNEANNINGISAPETIEDYDEKPSLHSLKISPALLALQEDYVKKVIETINDLDNVLYEIINEGGATDWQYHMIRFIKKTEEGMAKQHPVGMTHRADNIQKNQDLFDSPADWISPNAEPYSWKKGDSTISSSFKYDPPEADGKKVIIPDTDHLWGHGGNYKWVWKCFLRGLNPIFMDPWNPLPGNENEEKTTGWIYDFGGITKDDRNYPEYSLIRQNMGFARSFSQRINLENMIPRSELSSTGYCLANTGNEYLVYFPQGGEAKINMKEVKGEFSVEWFIPLMKLTVFGPRTIKAGNYLTIEPPTSLDAVLYLKRKLD
jgi:Family of unknown function (DUF6298)/Putative collagen-binding domain of a collagenase